MRYPVLRNKSSTERLIYKIGRGRGRGRRREAAAPKLVCATPYKVLYNLIN